LSLDDFEQLFSTIVLARYRYVSDRWDDDLVSLDPFAVFVAFAASLGSLAAVCFYHFPPFAILSPLFLF
jgi:hypothetical protein